MIRSEFVACLAAKRLAGVARIHIEWRRFFLSCALSLVFFLPARAAVFYPFPDDESYDLVNGVSPDGRIILTSRHTWSPSGGLVPFSPGGSDVYSRDISNNGVVIGLWCGPNTGSCYEAFRTPADGPMQGLGAFDNFASDAFAVTPDGGVVVGNASSQTVTQSFRWTQATGMVGLGHLRQPGLYSHDGAFGVSADGSVIVGQSGDDMILEAYRWTRATGMTGLGDLAGGTFNSSAKGISSDGQVIVGFATGTQGLEAFRWTEATGIVGLGELPGGDYYSSAVATTADGSIIVGQSRTSLGNEAFIWDAAHGMRNLREVLISEHGLGGALAGWTLTDALDISNDGNVIVGQGYDPAGELSGFVVVIPEPATALIAVAALLPIGASWRRRPRTASTSIL
jgi:probable HAF family extracellular repeat protein